MSRFDGVMHSTTYRLITADVEWGETKRVMAQPCMFVAYKPQPHEVQALWQSWYVVQSWRGHIIRQGCQAAVAKKPWGLV